MESLAVGADRYLQTSPEYHMKRLLAAGSGAIYQLGQAFRAGERGPRHNPEFTLLEWYRPGFDDGALRREVSELVDEILGPAPYRELSYAEVLASQPPGPAAEGWSDAELAYERFDRAVARLDGRVFVVAYPPEQAALARLRNGVAARFELLVDGLELANGYYELGDAAALRQRFESDREQRQRAHRPLPAIDERFLAAMRAGLPDCAGVALGIDRLLMLKLGLAHMDEVLAFSDQRC